jgi:hypothetical protein
LSSNALDLRDSFEYVALAIRFDESRPESEQLLQTPLDGRLYDCKHHAIYPSLGASEEDYGTASEVSDVDISVSVSVNVNVNGA